MSNKLVVWNVYFTKDVSDDTYAAGANDMKFNTFKYLKLT